MRFTMMVGATKDTEAGVIPEEQLIAAMGKYNEALANAGVLLDLSGLQPSSKGARIKFSGDKRTVVHGPFPDTQELIAGYWLIQVKSKEAAIEWAKRARAPRRRTGRRNRDSPALRTAGFRSQQRNRPRTRVGEDAGEERVVATRQRIATREGRRCN